MQTAADIASQLSHNLDTVLLNISGGGMICEGLEKIVFINEKAAAIQGYTPDEFLQIYGDVPVANILPSDFSKVRKIWNAQMSEGDEYDIKHKVRHKNGTIRTIINRGRKIKDASGKTFYYSLMQDVTEIEERTLNLKNAFSLQTHLLNVLSCGVLAYTYPEHKIVSMNRETERIFDYEDDKNGNENFYTFIQGKIRSDDLKYVHQITPTLKKVGDEISYKFHTTQNKRRKNDEGLTVQCVSRLVQLEDEQKIVLTVIQDISAEERHFKAIQDFTMMQEQIVKTLNFGILCYTIPDYEILILNDEARRIMECPKSTEKKDKLNIKRFVLKKNNRYTIYKTVQKFKKSRRQNAI